MCVFTLLYRLAHLSGCVYYSSWYTQSQPEILINAVQKDYIKQRHKSCLATLEQKQNKMIYNRIKKGRAYTATTL